MNAKSVRERLARARTDLDAARLLLTGRFADQAASRAYYAAFYAAEAALLLLGQTRSRHSGLIASFGKMVVKEGGFDREVAALLRDLFDLRNDADYDFAPLTEEHARAAVADAERFVIAIEEWIGRQQTG